MSTERPSDAAILAGIAATLRDVVIPALARDGEVVDPFTRVTAVQLAGLASYAAKRSADPATARLEQVAATLDLLYANEVVRQCTRVAGGPHDPLAVASAALVACVGRFDPAANEVRATLRAVLVAQLDDELLSTSPLMDAFRGRLRDA